ncbi:MAG: [dimethylamine--corrinoid protein] Co-methyltransferase, partial [Deltaproteobacteria bacterium]|nr:[dimethylamine--corrinoid protein] Co-methyltransferase [Deltaproteobacteria bacterium]
MAKVFSRLGDGSPIELTEVELMRDLEEGTADAADRGKIPPLSEEELKYLFDIFISPARFVSVERGKEVVLSYDAGTLKIRRVGVSVNRIQALQIYEKLL